MRDVVELQPGAEDPAAHVHGSLVRIDTDETEFPVELPHEWRAAHVQKYEEFCQGWVLSNAQQTEVI